MRSRIAITLMLVFGFAFSGAGVGMAVTGVTTEDQSAAAAQYGGPAPAGPAPQGVTPPAPGVTLAPEPTEPNEVIGEVDEGEEPTKVAPAKDKAPVEETRQLAAEEGGEELPFTGFAAIPVLLLGFALLTGGFALRRGDR